MNKISEAARVLGKIKSTKKKMAAQLNGSKPCKDGKKRGWPKGKRRAS